VDEMKINGSSERNPALWRLKDEIWRLLEE